MLFLGLERSLSDTGEQKIKISAGLTSRVVTAIQAEADRVGISFADKLRRITDDWLDDFNRAQTQPHREVLVLDRESGVTRRAR